MTSLSHIDGIPRPYLEEQPYITKTYRLNHFWIAMDCDGLFKPLINTTQAPLLGSFPSRACTAQFRRAPPHLASTGIIFLDFGFGFVPNFARGFSSSTRAVSAHPNIDVGKEGEPSQLLLHHTAHPQEHKTLQTQNRTPVRIQHPFSNLRSLVCSFYYSLHSVTPVTACLLVLLQPPFVRQFEYSIPSVTFVRLFARSITASIQ